MLLQRVEGESMGVLLVVIGVIRRRKWKVSKEYGVRLTNVKDNDDGGGDGELQKGTTDQQR